MHSFRAFKQFYKMDFGLSENRYKEATGSLSSYPGLISGGFGKGFVKLVFPTSQYVSSIPLP